MEVRMEVQVLAPAMEDAKETEFQSTEKGLLGFAAPNSRLEGTDLDRREHRVNRAVS